MASGKFEKKSTQRNIKSYRSSATKQSGKYTEKSSPPKYKVPAGLTRRIFALVTTALIAKNFIAPNPPHGTTYAAEPTPSSSSVVSTLEFTPEPTILTLGIGNYGAEITVDNPQTPGEDNYSIYDSFVIVYENNVVTSDVNGNFLKGHLDNGDFTTIAQLTESELKDFNFYQVNSENGANLIYDGNNIATVPNGDYVLALKSNDNEQSLKTVSIINGNAYLGYIDSNLLNEIGDFEAISYKADQNVNDIENIGIVNTKSADYINLNLREQPGQDIITQIPHGSFVHMLGDTKQYGNKTWSLVKYISPDGSEYQGWIDSGNYLSYSSVPEKPGPKIRDGINVNSTGNVSGIDISGMSKNDLEKLCKNGITAKTTSIHGNFNTSELEGQIGFVGIKLGASSYRPGNLNILEYNNYIQQVEFCEENHIPYTLYYYSTSIKEAEALDELQVIEKRVNDLKQKYGLKYCISIAIDKELAENSKSDRQKNGNIPEQTKALATLINGIQERDLSENVLIYSPGRVMQPDLDQIFDLNYLHNILSNPENVALWQCALMYKNGVVTQNLKDDIAYGESCGFSTAITQVVLDAKVNSGEKYDINSINFNWYKDATNHLDITNTTAYTLEFDDKNSQNNNSNNNIYSLNNHTTSNSEYDNEYEI